MENNNSNNSSLSNPFDSNVSGETGTRLNGVPAGQAGIPNDVFLRLERLEKRFDHLEQGQNTMRDELSATVVNAVHEAVIRALKSSREQDFADFVPTPMRSLARTPARAVRDGIQLGGVSETPTTLPTTAESGDGKNLAESDVEGSDEVAFDGMASRGGPTVMHSEAPTIGVAVEAPHKGAEQLLTKVIVSVGGIEITLLAGQTILKDVSNLASCVFLRNPWRCGEQEQSTSCLQMWLGAFFRPALVRRETYSRLRPKFAVKFVFRVCCLQWTNGVLTHHGLLCSRHCYVRERSQVTKISSLVAACVCF